MSNFLSSFHIFKREHENRGGVKGRLWGKKNVPKTQRPAITGWGGGG